MITRQPTCWACWTLRQPGLRPLRAVSAPSTRCCFCGGSASAGIYVHADPQLVPYPTDEGVASQ